MKEKFCFWMKKTSFIFVVISILMLVGCGKEKEISVQAQYIRTDGLVENVEYPVIQKIQSKEELTQYYRENLDQYNFSDNSATSVSFTTAIDKYDESYFEDSFLVIVLLEEEGSSILHHVKKVSDDGNILIEKIMPDMESTDIANWHILIEVDKKYKDLDFKVSFDKISNT